MSRRASTGPSPIRWVVVLATLLGSAAPAAAALRCGTDLVVEGDSVVKLLDSCGEPTYGDAALFLDTAEWTYNFGPDEFMHRVLIRDGRVERIEELGRGIEPPALEDEAGDADAS